MTASHYDVWLTAAGRAYQAVPYEVLADWLQQGRVVPDDRVRPAGASQWLSVAEVPTLAVYLPVPSPTVPEDRAEALEPLDLGVHVRHRRLDDEDDVDMVPLIDISLVLLIFFMMTTTVAGGAARIDVPPTRFAHLSNDRETLWVGVDLGPSSNPVYSLAEGGQAPVAGDQRLNLREVIDKLRSRLQARAAGRTLSVRVAAHHRLPIEVVQGLMAELTRLKPIGLSDIKAEVTERPR
jgi:biopolymer transport protein ExbD